MSFQLLNWSLLGTYSLSFSLRVPRLGAGPLGVPFCACESERLNSCDDEKRNKKVTRFCSGRMRFSAILGLLWKGSKYHDRKSEVRDLTTTDQSSSLHSRQRVRYSASEMKVQVPSVTWQNDFDTNHVSYHLFAIFILTRPAKPSGHTPEPRTTSSFTHRPLQDRPILTPDHGQSRLVLGGPIRPRQGISHLLLRRLVRPVRSGREIVIARPVRRRARVRRIGLRATPELGDHFPGAGVMRFGRVRAIKCFSFGFGSLRCCAARPVFEGWVGTRGYTRLQVIAFFSFSCRRPRFAVVWAEICTPFLFFSAGGCFGGEWESDRGAASAGGYLKLVGGGGGGEKKSLKTDSKRSFRAKR